MVRGLQALLEASRQWEASRQCARERDRTVIVLCTPNDYEGGCEGVPDTWQPLVDALEVLGARVSLLDWMDDQIDWDAQPRLVLPLLTWNYCESVDRFALFLQQLCASGATPRADLVAVEWILHKRYLLELHEAGIPIVPTRVLSRGATIREVRDALKALSVQERLEREAEQQAMFVYKPSVGSRGDGVELLRTGEAADEAALTSELRAGDVLIQPFLRRVRRDGELCVCFINGRMLHTIRKNPDGWGGMPTGRAGELPQDKPAADAAVPAPPARRHACESQPVEVLEPPPCAAVAVAQRALEHVQRRAAGMPFIARVDLLPSSSGWLVSELELGWADLFLRARPAAAAVVARELFHHLPAEVHDEEHEAETNLDELPGKAKRARSGCTP